ncbi:hypothetical protein KFK09_004751 [Dendrobium nobile]|uniref:DNA repair metallo-beta-lactamase domain-containing protein n=1 Tax=Dendrobium nobile TaxID=94219 RepID=A0A8T3BW95_DENNO|nr:hypothetical protein KFK09_004751 [Dendrobium nobile]
MPIETPRGLPFSVDTWSHASKQKRHHFLTHAHKDHLSGIAAFCSFPIYCTRLTKTLVCHQFPELDDSLFLEIKLGELLVVKDPDGDFSVRAFDANHCPGAVMFLFEGGFGNILHTGDCRLDPECLQNFPLKYANKNERYCNLDYIFLDCTFGRCSIEIPSKKLAIQQVVEGFPSLSERASKKIAEARANFHPEPLFIRPSTQWYATNDLAHRLKLSEAERDECGIWHVCYSMHSSREELEWALQVLQPKWVISTTPPCRAMELDYVKKHCFKTRITHDDPIWKLFYGTSGNSATFSASTNSMFPENIDAAITEVSQASTEFSIVNLKEMSIDHLELKFDLSTPPVAVPITLFGRARLGDQHINILQEEKKHCSENTENISLVSTQVVVDVHESSSSLGRMDAIESTRTQKQELLFQNTLVEPIMKKWRDGATQYLPDNVNHAPEQFERVDEQICLVDIASTKVSDATVPNFEYLKDDNSSSESDKSYIGSSKNINANLRRLYRSMNVPVPRPLSSVVGLMNSIKRFKTGPDSSF